MNPSIAAWFHPASSILDPAMRPITLGTLEVMRLMGITLLSPEIELTLEEEARQIAAYHWLHTDDIETIKRMLWDGTWRLAFNGIAPSEIIIAHYRSERDRLLPIIAAATTTTRRRPRHGDSDSTPADVIAPSLFTHRLVTVSQATQTPIHEVQWTMPLAQALQAYHCALWSEGQWTVKPGQEVKEEDFESFDLDALTAESGCE